MKGAKERGEREKEKENPFTSANLSLINTRICLENILFIFYKRRNV